MAPGESPL